MLLLLLFLFVLSLKGFVLLEYLVTLGWPFAFIFDNPYNPAYQLIIHSLYCVGGRCVADKDTLVAFLPF